MCGISPPATSLQVMVGTRSWVSDLDLEQPLLVAKLERERDAARMEAQALRQDSLGAQAELTRLLQEIKALSASEAELRHRLDAAEAQKRDAELAHQEAQTTADASHALLQSRSVHRVLDLNNTIEVGPRGSSAHEAPQPIHEPVEQSEVTTQTDEDGMESKLHALRCEKAELLAGTQLLVAENDGLRKRVADLEAVKPTAETIQLETAPGPEDPSALLAQREQEIRLLMTALTEANRRFEALGCRRVEVDGDSPASRSHPGTVAGLRIHNLRRTWSDSPSNHAGVYVPSRLLHRPPQDTEASHLKSTSTSSVNSPPPFRTAPMSMRLAPGIPPPPAGPLDPRTVEQFREIPITLGYLLHLKLSFQAADTDQQGALDLIKLGRWCVKVGYVDIAFSHLQSMIEQVDVTRTGTVAFWPFFAIQSHLHLNLGAKGHPLRDWLAFVTSPSTTRRASEPLHGVVSPIRPASAKRLREHGPDT
eukprot:TRINITY_DN4494_c0_g1_i1.p1 TRINITY_DN4494_c0_g1~~TRINITY_DN4494_c0_g1_i1.p1  ORF type:complete len:478 (+),score=58.18 TRINITY_DN4494_c0_g1_i1:687-2120(+)